MVDDRRKQIRIDFALNAPDGKEAQEFVYDEERDLFTGVENPEYILEGDQPEEFFTWVMEESGRVRRYTIPV